MNKNLISEFKLHSAICSSTDYGVKKSVAKHNRSAKRMLEIIKSLEQEEIDIQNQICEELLATSENNTSLWAATSILEYLSINPIIKRKSLDIIESAASGNDLNATGFQIWLRNWHSKNN